MLYTTASQLFEVSDHKKDGGNVIFKVKKPWRLVEVVLQNCAESKISKFGHRSDAYSTLKTKM